MIKKILPYRLYRCHQCQWRGWISNRRVKGQSAFIQLGFFYIGVMALSFLVALALWTLLH
ncbi:hypothetical protein JW835_14235 [bacterium]|nr:hypothetical protein [bacterium]